MAGYIEMMICLDLVELGILASLLATGGGRGHTRFILGIHE